MAVPLPPRGAFVEDRAKNLLPFTLLWGAPPSQTPPICLGAPRGAKDKIIKIVCFAMFLFEFELIPGVPGLILGPLPPPRNPKLRQIFGSKFLAPGPHRRPSGLQDVPSNTSGMAVGTPMGPRGAWGSLGSSGVPWAPLGPSGGFPVIPLDPRKCLGAPWDSLGPGLQGTPGDPRGPQGTPGNPGGSGGPSKYPGKKRPAGAQKPQDPHAQRTVEGLPLPLC